MSTFSYQRLTDLCDCKIGIQDVACPECGQGQLVVKRTRKGRTFYSCNRYPECKFAVWQRPLPEPCPKCGGLLLAQAGGKDPTKTADALEAGRRFALAAVK